MNNPYPETITDESTGQVFEDKEHKAYQRGWDDREVVTKELYVDAYVALLRTPIKFRINIQRELCQLRDFIAKATNLNAETIQNKYEAEAAIEAGGK